MALPRSQMSGGEKTGDGGHEHDCGATEHETIVREGGSRTVQPRSKRADQRRASKLRHFPFADLLCRDRKAPRFPRAPSTERK